VTLSRPHPEAVFGHLAAAWRRKGLHFSRMSHLLGSNHLAAAVCVLGGGGMGMGSKEIAPPTARSRARSAVALFHHKGVRGTANSAVWVVHSRPPLAFAAVFDARVQAASQGTRPAARRQRPLSG
jgi:hypothetical protein